MANPYPESKKSKKSQVTTMFDNIAWKYDFLNHFLSFGIDKIWRRKALKKIKSHFLSNSIDNPHILDIATGTGDLAIKAAKMNMGKITGVDISKEMLEIGKKKINKKRLNDLIELQIGDSENLSFSDNTFNAVIVAFGVRNFEDLEKGLKEMLRVLKPNGICMVLELSKPDRFPLKQLYYIYFSLILPLIGRVFSKDKSAYSYLPESVDEFPKGEKFISIFKSVGYKNCSFKKLSFGASNVYLGTKL